MRNDIPGWLTEAEGALLARHAEGKVVLEIGSYMGRSTVYLASTAQMVFAIDPFDGRTVGDQDTLRAFIANIEKYNVGHKIRPRVGITKHVLPELGQRFEFVFIDGDHSFGAVCTDIELTLKTLLPNGRIAFHDSSEYGPKLAIEKYAKELGTRVDEVDSITVWEPPCTTAQNN